ncbi:hypothetical protein STEG23_009539, partial [Scotinomys teguina]
NELRKCDTYTQWSITQQRKNNTTMKFAGKWKELENIILSEDSFKDVFISRKQEVNLTKLTVKNSLHRSYGTRVDMGIIGCVFYCAHNFKNMQGFHLVANAKKSMTSNEGEDVREEVHISTLVGNATSSYYGNQCDDFSEI